MDSLFNNKQKKVSIWTVVFIILLIVHGIFFYWVGILSGSYGGGMVIGIMVIPLVLPVVAIIDFIAVLSYFIIHKPQGLARDISYTVLIVISVVFVYFAIMLINSYFL
jgi:hypothetical protein